MQTSFPSPTVPIVSAGAVEDSGDDDDDDDDYDGIVPVSCILHERTSARSSEPFVIL